MKYNYPVKYTAMPIIEQVGWSPGLHELERDYDVVCYIASKCFLISDRTKYKENGKKEKEYEVVFPYQKNIFDNRWERVTPAFNNECINSNCVEKVFDSYSEALEYVKKKNEELRDKNRLYISSKKSLEKIQEFNDRLSGYKLLEQQILDNTSNLEQSNVKELDRLILSSKGKIKVLSSSLYEYLNYSTYSKFIVYSISLEQYNKLLTLINNQDLSDISNVFKNASPILYYDHKINDKKIMVINKNGNILYYINKWGTLINNDEQKLPSVELSALDNDIEYSFTTETLEDIIISFNQPKYINLNDIQGPILKKTLFDKNKK